MFWSLIKNASIYSLSSRNSASAVSSRTSRKKLQFFNEDKLVHSLQCIVLLHKRERFDLVNSLLCHCFGSDELEGLSIENCFLSRTLREEVDGPEILSFICTGDFKSDFKMGEFE